MKRLSLPLRIFLIHLAYTLVFALGAGWLAIYMVQDAYDRYSARWRTEVETFNLEQMFYPMANEVARSLLLKTTDVPQEVRDTYRERISQGLSAVLKGLPVVESVIILDRDHRIVYASDSGALDLAFRGEYDLALLASAVPTRQVIDAEDGPRTRLLVPVYDERPEADLEAPRDRLGSVLVVYGSDPDLMARVPAVRPPSVEDMDITLPVVVLVIAMAAGSLLIAAIISRPVRRVERAVREYRARGFRGGLQVGGLGQGDGLAATVEAFNELGGQLEAMDRKGRERDALLATLSDALEDGMVALGPDGDPRVWNRAALRILDAGDGASEDEASGDTTDSDASRLAIVEALERNPVIRSAPSAPAEVRQREVTLRLPDGEVTPANITVIPIETAPGEVGTLVLMRDLAALRRVETHLLESSRYAILAHLAAGLAHEIRNPLHSIGINAGVVEQYVDRERSEDNRLAMEESLSSIQDETRRLTSLLNNYLGLMKPSETETPVDVRELCRRVIRLLQYTATQSGVRIHLVGSETLPLVHGVADRLQQAILNLVLNGIQAMPDGGDVRIETLASGQCVDVAVSDTGPGVPDELQGQLFNIRVTTKPGGTGLGLPLVRLIAENHGGAIHYASEPGQGSRFTLSLPVRQVA